MFDCWCYHMFVHMLIIYCLFTAFCQLSVIGHNVYGMLLCITYLDVIMFLCACFLSPFIARIALHLICGKCFMMFQYSIYGIICMLSKLVPEIFFSCDGCYFKVLTVPSYYVACHCDSDCVWSIVMLLITYSNNCSMGPWSSFFSLDCYSRPYWK